MYNEIILLNNKFIFFQDTLIFLGNVLFFSKCDCFFGRMYLFILLQISENLYTVYRKKLMYV